jgi:hypothetical protein
MNEPDPMERKAGHRECKQIRQECAAKHAAYRREVMPVVDAEDIARRKQQRLTGFFACRDKTPRGTPPVPSGS